MEIRRTLWYPSILADADPDGGWGGTRMGEGYGLHPKLGPASVMSVTIILISLLAPAMQKQGAVILRTRYSIPFVFVSQP